MQCNNRQKLLALFTGLFLLGSMLQCHADRSCAPNSVNYAQGARDWANNCARCHNLRGAMEFTPEQWQVIMQHMRIQCSLTGQEARNISAFLMAQSAPAQSPSVNQQPAVQPAQGMTTSSSPSKTPAPISKTKASIKNQPMTQTSAGLSGSVVYHQTCVVCHGANGKGVVPGAPDFTSKNGPLSKSDALLLEHIEHGYQSPGSPMAMPPRGGNPKLTNQELKNALNYIRSAFGK